MIEIIKSPVRNSNAITLLEKNQYTFDVDHKVTKTEVKRWIEGVFGIRVIGMNSKRLPSKKKRVGPTMGYPTRYKRMIVTVYPKQSIPVF